MQRCSMLLNAIHGKETNHSTVDASCTLRLQTSATHKTEHRSFVHLGSDPAATDVMLEANSRQRMHGSLPSPKLEYIQSHTLSETGSQNPPLLKAISLLDSSILPAAHAHHQPFLPEAQRALRILFPRPFLFFVFGRLFCFAGVGGGERERGRMRMRSWARTLNREARAQLGMRFRFRLA